MESHDTIAAIAICAATAVTCVNLLKNGDGISIAALFGLIGSIVGFSFGRKTQTAS